MSPKKLIKRARKWQEIAAMGKRFSFPRSNGSKNVDSSYISLAGTGNFVIYTIEDQRFVLPISYLRCNIFIKLLKMSEEEFGLPSEGPIKLPCDTLFMEYIVSLIQKGLGKDVEKALLISMETSCCSLSTSFYQGNTAQQLLVCG
ncbi:hypothetical protein JCGZ_18746 [Jatropha curcas]|uniref:Uncharacterized protein n=1 Tax=Jatropha curcas TaxID=180498 RepID=A0A067KDP4_JATCU|nr:auxin-responsive protein SAUR63 [Jatropha curcas]KDP29979.1 hypothetical protein JCGZ_18746 [Jatropha curcas]